MDALNNIKKADISLDQLNILLTTFGLYYLAKENRKMYDNMGFLRIPRTLITYYYSLINPDYEQMLYNFRKKYISGESTVEDNTTPAEKAGIGYIYDYIQRFDISKDSFSIFINSMLIHNLLYQEVDRQNDGDNARLLDEAREELEQAKKNKDLVAYRAAREKVNSLGNASAHIGGFIRNVNVRMNDFDYEPPDASEVVKLFNEYLQPYKVKEYEDALNSDDIFNYIDYCVKTTADLIALQPFIDGNKRTFRSLLNLMFKKKNLPPVYVTEDERDIYHLALEKAICKKDYRDLQTFYYYKICDSIYELDFVPFYKSYSEMLKDLRSSSITDDNIHDALAIIGEQTSGDDASSRT